MNLTLFNVDFGESIMISDSKGADNLLIDYGSEVDTNINYINKSLNSIQKNNKKLQAMMTHFHDDHINGFICLALNSDKLFSRVYIPNIFSTYSNYNVNDITYVEIEILIFFLQNYKVGTGTLSLFELLRAIMGYNGELCILQRGDEFEVGDMEYVTLWPNISEIEFLKYSTINELNYFLSVLSSELEKEVDLRHEINEVANELTRTFFQRCKFYNKKEYESNVIELEEKLKKLKEYAIELNKKNINKNRRDDLNKWIKRLKSNANKISIVFQSKNNIVESNILMTGDIDKYRLNWILNNKLCVKIPIHESFYIIKAPHHGTQSYFVSNLPKSKNILISNGETNKVNRGRISSSYLMYESRGALINCTNSHRARCDLLIKNKSCDGNCNMSINKKEFRF